LGSLGLQIVCVFESRGVVGIFHNTNRRSLRKNSTPIGRLVSQPLGSPVRVELSQATLFKVGDKRLSALLQADHSGIGFLYDLKNGRQPVLPVVALKPHVVGQQPQPLECHDWGLSFVVLLVKAIGEDGTVLVDALRPLLLLLLV